MALGRPPTAMEDKKNLPDTGERLVEEQPKAHKEERLPKAQEETQPKAHKVSNKIPESYLTRELEVEEQPEKEPTAQRRSLFMAQLVVEEQLEAQEEEQPNAQEAQNEEPQKVFLGDSRTGRRGAASGGVAAGGATDLGGVWWRSSRRPMSPRRVLHRCP